MSTRLVVVGIGLIDDLLDLLDFAKWQSQEMPLEMPLEMAHGRVACARQDVARPVETPHGL